ncbi:MAG: HEAT repeat domain-containing protein [Planctomycetota bacterium]|jgi:HEAT repeat protein
MSSKPLGILLVACLAGGCQLFSGGSERERFIDLLEEFEASRPKGKQAALQPAQAQRAKRLKEWKKVDPRAYVAASQALDNLENPDPAVRRRAIVKLVRYGKLGETYLRFAAGFFNPSSPSDLDALLAKTDDPAVFQLRKIELTGEEREREEASRGLDLFLEVKTRCLLEWMDHSATGTGSPHFFEILTAGNRALVPLEKALKGKSLRQAELALRALLDLGSLEAAMILAAVASAPARGLIPPEDALRALLSMEPGVFVPVAGDLLSKTRNVDSLLIAWVVAAKALPVHDDLLKNLAESEDPDLQLAGLAGRLRLGVKAPDAIEQLALEKGAVAEPLSFLVFLREHPHLAGPFTRSLCRLSREKRVNVREAACGLLAFLDDGPSASALKEAMTDSEISVRTAAVEAASRRLRSGSEPVLLEGLRVAAEDRNDGIRRMALLGLGRARDGASKTLLVDRVRGPDGGDARAALEAISHFRDPELLAQLPLRLYWGEDGEARCLLVQALAMAWDSSALEALHALLRAPDKGFRAKAVKLLDSESARGMVPVLRRLLNSNDQRTKIAALLLLARLKDDNPATGPRSFLSSRDDDLVRAAVLALSIGGESFESLSALSESGDPVLRHGALAALAREPDPRVVRRFEAGIFEGSTLLRVLSVRALGKIGDDASIPFIVAAASDPHRDVRAEVALALASAGGETGGKILERLWKDPDPLVKTAAAAGLKARGRDVASELIERLRGGEWGGGPIERAELLAVLGDFSFAAQLFAQSVRFLDPPHVAWIDASAAHARDGKGDEALKALAKARDLGFESMESVSDLAPFRSLMEDPDFSKALRAIFRPTREGMGFLSRFRGEVKLILENGSDLDGRLVGFRDERFILVLPSGESEIPKRQVQRVEFKEQ